LAIHRPQQAARYDETVRLAALLTLLLSVGVGCTGDLPPPSPRPAIAIGSPDPDAIHISGTGAMTPLMTLLAEEWTRRGGIPHVLIEESIGSGGGIRATYDGAIDLGMVSRPLSSEELRLGLVQIPVGQDVVALVAHPGLGTDEVSAEELPALYRGERTRFANGAPAVPLLRDRSESANAALDRIVPGLQAAREQAYRQRRHRVLYNDRAMAEAIASTPGSFGVFSLSWLLAYRLPLKVLRLSGVSPSPDAVLAGRYRGSRELFFVVRKERLPRTTALLDFLRSPEVNVLIRSHGYLPARQESAP
jgi:phosphate transport system substrate-binding protein